MVLNHSNSSHLEQPVLKGLRMPFFNAEEVLTLSLQILSPKHVMLAYNMVLTGATAVRR